MSDGAVATASEGIRDLGGDCKCDSDDTQSQANSSPPKRPRLALVLLKKDAPLSPSDAAIVGTNRERDTTDACPDAPSNAELTTPKNNPQENTTPPKGGDVPQPPPAEVISPDTPPTTITPDITPPTAIQPDITPQVLPEVQTAPRKRDSEPTDGVNTTGSTNIEEWMQQQNLRWNRHRDFKANRKQLIKNMLKQHDVQLTRRHNEQTVNTLHAQWSKQKQQQSQKNNSTAAQQQQSSPPPTTEQSLTVQHTNLEEGEIPPANKSPHTE
ncbi:hypothetical protein Pelo_16878 [Pelomyxa schiedti]|nr:hypothetical protein Pelo_16878 [Pelomyxa schiedti]